MKQRLKPKSPVVVPRASNWVPPEQRDTAWYLFNEWFLCRIQAIHTVSLEDMREYGTPTSGDAAFDAQMRNERVERMFTVSKMFEYWREGITVGVVNELDTKKIYEIISNHLVAWKHHLQYEVNVRGAPLDELVKLDEFANTVHKHAKYHFTKDYVDSLLGRRIDEIRHAKHNVIKPYEELAVTRISTDGKSAEEARTAAEAARKEQYPDRVSLSDAFKRGQSNGGVSPFPWRHKS